LATPESNEGAENVLDHTDLTLRLTDLRREIGALRQELMASGGSPALNENSYRSATRLDLLVNKFLRLGSADGKNRA